MTREIILTVMFTIAAGAFYAFCDAVNSNIRDVRTHKAAHPYRDMYHLMIHLGRFSLFAFSGGAIKLWQLSGALWGSVEIVSAVAVSYWVWRSIYQDDAELCYAIDESTRISTGWPWLDKLLGFHH
jgi:hypothetical protein